MTRTTSLFHPKIYLSDLSFFTYSVSSKNIVDTHNKPRKRLLRTILKIEISSILVKRYGIESKIKIVSETINRKDKGLSKYDKL